MHQNSHDNKGYVTLLERFINEAVKPFTTGLEKGLDFGCGPGPVLSNLLSNLGMHMEIYDPYFFNDLDLEGKKYDLITATEVFEHLRKPRFTISRLKELLNKGGLLAVMTLFHSNYDFKTWWYRNDPTHVCFYSPKTCHWIAHCFSLQVRYINDKNICVWQK